MIQITKIRFPSYLIQIPKYMTIITLIFLLDTHPIIDDNYNLDLINLFYKFVSS